MGEVAQNFIKRFHSLPGETVKQKHQNFYGLLHEHLYLRNTPEDLESITINLNVTTHLEKILRIDFLIYFHRFHELYEDFKKGDEITVQKLSKQEWFFQKAFKEVSSEVFANSILPTVSYSLKVKILSKLPLEEQQADEFFDAVCKQYGIFFSTALLPKCTSQKIREVLTTYPVKLSIAQLKAIFDKNSDLIYVYFDERIKHEGSSSFIHNHPILVHIAQQNPAVFSNLHCKYHLVTKLGRRTTKRFIASQKDEVIKDLETYINILNKGATVRRLGTELKDLIYKSPVDLKHMLMFYPKQQQFNLYRSAYDSFFYKKLEENIDDISDDIFKIMNPEEREMLAKKKIEKGADDYLKYVSPDYCLKEVMEKISHSNPAQRNKYLQLAIQCCIFNQDVSALLKICELLCGRFKNDSEQIHSSFLNILGTNEHLLDSFTKQHWQYVIELIAIVKAKRAWIYHEHVLMSNYMHFSLNNNIPITEIVQKSYDWRRILRDSNLRKNAKLFKLTVNALIEVGLIKTDPNRSGSVTCFYCMLPYFCKLYNEENPEDIIDISSKPKIIQSIKELLQNEDFDYPEPECINGMEYIICQKTSSEDIHELKKLYFNRLKDYGRQSGLMWFLKHEPEIVQDNFDKFLASAFNIWRMNRKSVWRFIKKYDHMNFGQRAIAFFKQKLTEEGYNYKENLVEALTILANPAAHLELIKLYAPISDDVNLTDEDTRKLYSLQGKLVKCLHMLNSPAKVAPATMIFCKGDYLKFALSPLYSCMYKLPENETRPFIDKINETKALSVRKHAMHLSCVIYDTKTVHGCLKNATVPSLIAKIKYFSKNPSDDLWELIETSISTTKKEDLQLLTVALDLNVPFEYKSKYLQVMWKVIDKFDNQQMRKIVLTKIDKEIIQTMDSEFAFQVIQNIFGTEESYLLVAKILIYLKTDEKYTFLSNILTTFKKDSWGHLDKKRKALLKLNRFVFDLFNIYMIAEDSDKKFVAEITTLFSSIFSLSEALQEIILIKCMTLKNDSESSANFLVVLNDMFYKTFGTSSVNVLADTLNNRIRDRFFFMEKHRVRLCQSMLQLNPSVSNYLLVLKLMPKIEPKDKQNYALYNDVVSQLSQVSDNIIQLEFNLFLKSK